MDGTVIVYCNDDNGYGCIRALNGLLYNFNREDWWEGKTIPYSGSLPYRGLFVVFEVMGDKAKRIYAKKLLLEYNRLRETKSSGNVLGPYTEICTFTNQITTSYQEVKGIFFQRLGNTINITNTVQKTLKLEMVKLTEGHFRMGELNYDDPDNGFDITSQATVKVNPFAIGKYPVTQIQYETVMGDNPSFFKGNPNNPVENVTWDNIQEFCLKLSEATGKKYRLPTDAEWEYACRAGTNTDCYYGDIVMNIDDDGQEYNSNKLFKDCGWFKENSGGITHPVGEKNPNPWFIYDMLGNVLELCYEQYPSQNDLFTSEKFILRGGAWQSFSYNSTSGSSLVVTLEVINGGVDRVNRYGFRVAFS